MTLNRYGVRSPRELLKMLYPDEGMSARIPVLFPGQDVTARTAVAPTRFGPSSYRTTMAGSPAADDQSSIFQRPAALSEAQKRAIAVDLKQIEQLRAGVAEPPAPTHPAVRSWLARKRAEEAAAAKKLALAERLPDGTAHWPRQKPFARFGS